MKWHWNLHKGFLGRPQTLTPLPINSLSPHFLTSQTLVRVSLEQFNLQCYRLFTDVDQCFDLQISLNLFVTGLLEIAHI